MESIVQESVRGKIGTIKRNIDSQLEIRKEWNQSKKNQIYEERDLPDEIYSEIDSCFTGMRNSSSFLEYKGYFQKLCKLTKIPSEHSIIVKYKVKRTKEHNSVYIEWNQSPKKITIPKGSTLYHTSTVKDIDSLEPAYKGKSAKSYLYSSPRVYFTLRKSMPKFACDIKKDAKTTLYTPKEKIRSAYIDPLVPLYSFGAVFVETKNPIKVLKVEEEIKTTESVDFENENSFASLEEFMDFYGLEFAEDDESGNLYEEGVIKDKIGEITRKLDDDNFIKKTWNKVSDKIEQKMITINLDKEKKEELMKKYQDISENENYSVYKKAFDWICKLFKIPNKSVISHIYFDDKENTATIKCSVETPKKIIIPENVQLLHVSSNDSIKELNPTFRSKTKGYYLYPSKRVYFTLGKRIANRKAGLNKNDAMSHYTPKENIRTVYIDPSYTDFKTGAVYVDTSLPIPVEKIKEEKPKKLFKEDVQLLVYESCMDGVISKEERDFLLEIL